MIVYFIADLHLSEVRLDLTELFLHFMYGEAERAQAVYVFGDLSDFWIGDDERSVLTDTVKQAIRHLTGHEVKCYSIHGNRDFLLGKRFATETGMALLLEYQTVGLFGRKTFICHGDTLCMDDVRYQQFRRRVHQKWRQKLFLLLPLPLRVGIAKKIHQTSKWDKQRKVAEIMNISPQTVIETAGRYGADLLIHGHTHRQNIHRNGGSTRIVLGDWRKDRASILKIDEHGFGFIWDKPQAV